MSRRSAAVDFQFGATGTSNPSAADSATCLNINSFYSLLSARVVIGAWKTEYNHHRRLSSLGYLSPVDHARAHLASMTRYFASLRR